MSPPTWDPCSTPLARWPRLLTRDEIRPLLEDRNRLAGELQTCRQTHAALAEELRRISAAAADAASDLSSDLLKAVRDVATQAARRGGGR